MTAAFTPGPWKYEPKDGRQNQRIIALEEVVPAYHPTKPLATVLITAWKVDHKSAVPNALLIAAAPDMYEALRQAEACMSIVEPRSDTYEYLRILGDVRAALAKARGGQ